MAGALLTPTRVGDLNRSRVLQALCDNGPLSRADLARMAGVPRGTIGPIVQALIGAGLLEETPPAPDTGRIGKPARPVWFGPRAGLCGAVTFGEGAFEVAVVNARGELLDRTAGRFPATADADTVGAALCQGLAGLTGPSRESLLGVGVAVPGVCDVRGGQVLACAQIPALVGDHLVRRLGGELGCPVLVDEDTRSLALGEKWFGAGRGMPSFAAVQTGLGLGAGIVLDGTVHRGRAGGSSEVGHTCVVPDGDHCRCGLRGCWETIATLGWLRVEAARLDLPGAAGMTASGLVELARRGDAGAGRLLDRYAANLAVGLANLTQVLDVRLFVVHGDVVGGDERFRRELQAAVRERVLPHRRDGLRVIFSELDQAAGLLGAAGLVLSETFNLSI